MMDTTENLHRSSGVYCGEVLEAGKNSLMNYDSCAWFERRHKILKNLNAILIRPIVKNGSEKVHVHA